MPKQYEAIRDSLSKKGVPLKKAKQIAAATFNKQAKAKGKPPLAHYVKMEGGMKVGDEKKPPEKKRPKKR